MKRFFLALIATAAAACSEPPTVEQLIIAEIREMEAQIEAGERLNFMRHIAEDFHGQGGQMNREQLRAYVLLQFRRYKNLSARLLPITVQEVSPQEATADFRALVTGGPGLIPEDGQLYQFNTHWRLEGDEWLLAAAWWEPASLGESIN